ncbi:MAG TPA: murein L,D-transpeptidase family protein [Methylomirabilota bacterium]|nr:murein L,D-transpeptidase family protein [Methylomirabilota bacterium]
MAALDPAPARAVTIELGDVAPDRIERQRAFTEGTLPLPGTPDLARFDERLEHKGLKLGAPLFIRIFKAESEFEVWLRQGERFVLLDSYPICHWSGTIGPKLSEGDMQTPEGFYTVGLRQLHHSGRWPRSLNLGYPNRYDRALLRTGSYILLHGGCSSSGCFAMTDPVMDEIYKLARAAIRAGQRQVHVHVFPFRMTEANLAAHAEGPWIEFWRELKQGYDAFEATGLPPRINVCQRRYVVEPSRAPDLVNHGIAADCPAPPDGPQAWSPLPTSFAASAIGQMREKADPGQVRAQDAQRQPARGFVAAGSHHASGRRHVTTSNGERPERYGVATLNRD